MPEPPKIVHLDQFETIPGPGSLTWHPVRLTHGQYRSRFAVHLDSAPLHLKDSERLRARGLGCRRCVPDAG